MRTHKEFNGFKDYGSRYAYTTYGGFSIILNPVTGKKGTVVIGYDDALEEFDEIHDMQDISEIYKDIRTLIAKGIMME